MKLRLISIAAMTAFSLTTVWASEEISPEGTIDTLADAIAKNAPELKTAYYDGRIQQSELQSENMLADPNFELERVWGMHNIGNKLALGVSQEFSLPMVYSSRRRVVSAVGRETDARCREIYFEKRLEAAQALSALACAARKCSLCDSITAFARQNVEITDALLKKGEATKLDLYKAQLEQNRCERMHNAAMRELEDSRTAISSLLGPDASLDVDAISVIMPASLPALPAWSEVERESSANSPTRSLEQIHTELAQAQHSLVKAERWPNFSLGYSFQRELGDTFHGFSFGMSLPFYSRKHKEKAAELTRLKLLNDDTVSADNILAEMQGAYRNATSISEQIQLLDKVLGNSNGEILLSRMYEVGQINRTVYIQELMSVMELRLERIDLMRDYLSAIASVNRYR